MRTVLLLTLILVVGVTVRSQDDIPDIDDQDVNTEPADSEPADVADEPAQADSPTKEEPAKKLKYVSPKLPRGAHFYETFEDLDNYRKRWIPSQATKDGADSDIAKYDGKWEVEEPSDSQLIGDLSLVLKSKAHHHAISSQLDKPFEFNGKPFILQYEVRFKNGIECGGAYMKLISQQKSSGLLKFNDKTPYTIMFGPDKCGNDHKLHFIFRHKNPITGELEEKHAKKPKASIDSYFSDKKTHLYRLVVNPDNTYLITVDSINVNEGSLMKDVEPAVNPPKEIDDAEDKKPEDWDDRQKITDPNAVKPDDWDENAPEKIEDKNAVKPEGWLDEEPDLIADPDAVKPTDWDTDMDGEWEAPMINNPKCKEAPGCGEWKRPKIKNPDHKGTWSATFIDNPEYQGIWKPKKIPNPKFFEDSEPYKMVPIHAVGLELWSMTEDIVFDNILVTDDMSVADEWTKDTWLIKSKQEKASSSSGQSVVGAVLDATQERPWLWAVIIVVVVLPIVLIIAYCCFSGSKPEDLAAARKKTDEPTADDAPTEGNVKESDQEVQAQGTEDNQGGGDAPKKASKGDLEADEDSIPVEKSDADTQGESSGNEDEVVNDSANDSPSQAAHKRRTRKE